MKLTGLCTLILILTACFRSTNAPTTSDFKMPMLKNVSTPLPVKSVSKDLLSKAERESIYFSAQLEKEALKLLLKNSAFSDLTLFSVLSYAIETSTGVKKSPPGRLDCSRFRLEPDKINQRIINIYKTCEKPEVLMASLEKGLTSSSIQVTFFLKEWANVVGLSVTLTATNTVCDLEIAEKKLEKLDCKNWAYTIKTSAAASEELRLKEFTFRRHQVNQFVLKGGRYLDLIERNKFEIQIPMEGKIKIFEKEIKVIDEFADRIEAETSPKNRIEIKGVLNEKENQEEVSQKDSSQKEDSSNKENNTQKEDLGPQEDQIDGR